MPKKAPAKSKPLYRRKPPKPGGVAGGKWQVTRKAKSVGRDSVEPKSSTPSTLNPQPSTLVLPHAHLISPAHFELREDGSIGAPASGTARSQQPPNAVLEAGAPGSSTLNSQPSTMPPRVAFSDPARGIWLYHGNSLELLDAIAAKYPDGRFDAIFADPPAWP